MTEQERVRFNVTFVVAVQRLSGEQVLALTQRSLREDVLERKEAIVRALRIPKAGEGATCVEASA